MILDSKTYNDDILKITSSNIPFNKLTNKSVMITGSCGLIGSFIVDVLMKRNEINHDNITVIAYGRNIESIKNRFSKYLDSVNFKYICQDVDLPLHYDEKVDFIMYLAGNAHPSAFKKDPVGTIKTNIVGLMNILDYARENNVLRVLYTSTGEVYGEADDSVKEFKEEFSGYVNPDLTRSCYPSSKRCAETLCVSYSEQYGVSTVIARPCHVYGPTMTKNDSRVYAEFIRNILHDEDIVLRSEGKPIRSYCYVADAASAFLDILLCGKDKEAYNIANKESIVSIREMAEVIAKIGGKKVVFDIPKDTPSNTNPMQCGVLNAEKLESLGWHGMYDIKKGYENTIRILKEVENGL